MSNVHMPSFWLGAHSTLLALGVLTLTVSLWGLITVVCSSLCLWMNWADLQRKTQ